MKYKTTLYELVYWYGYGFKTYTNTIFADNKKQAIKKIMLSIAQNWSFCFGGGFQLFSIRKYGKWNKQKLFKGCYKYNAWKELKNEDDFVNTYKHYLWGLIEKGTIRDEITI